MTTYFGKLIFILLLASFFWHTMPADSFAYKIQQNELLVGKDPKYNSNVFLHINSITRQTPNIKRAVYCVRIDRLTEEYTADYNCADKTMHIFKVAIKDRNRVLERKDLYITEKTVKNSIDAKVLNAVCKHHN